MSNTIITISREFGSGGRQFARKLAEKLGYDYYDKQILTQIAEHTELSEAYIKSVVDRKPHSLLPISMGTSFSSGIDYPMQQMQTIYSAQFEIIEKMAAESNCVIVGRCADYILRKQNPFRIMVYANMDYKVQRCLANRKEGEPEREADMQKWIKKLDRARAQYYNNFTGQEWGDKEYFDLCINMANKDVDQMVDMVAGMFQK